MASLLFDAAVEKGTGQSVDSLRRTPLDELRRAAEARLGRPIKFVTAFPWVGRGNVLRGRLITREEAETAYERAIREL